MSIGKIADEAIKGTLLSITGALNCIAFGLKGEEVFPELFKVLYSVVTIGGILLMKSTYELWIKNENDVINKPEIIKKIFYILILVNAGVGMSVSGWVLTQEFLEGSLCIEIIFILIGIAMTLSIVQSIRKVG